MPVMMDLDDDLMPLSYIFCDHSILIADTYALKLPTDAVFTDIFQSQDLSDGFGEPEFQYKTLALETQCEAPEGYKWVPIRSLFDKDRQYGDKVQIAARAHSLLKWRKKKKYCSCCGGKLSEDKYETALVCEKCGAKIYPTVTPIVVVLIEKGDEVLLARHEDGNNGNYSCFAGFIEPGENAEQAVVREVAGELGIAVKDVKYVTSKAWPFPDQLMMLFKAEYKSGDISLLEGGEIKEAHWFKRDSLPEVSKISTVAWSLISGE